MLSFCRFVAGVLAIFCTLLASGVGAQLAAVSGNIFDPRACMVQTGGIMCTTYNSAPMYMLSGSGGITFNKISFVGTTNVLYGGNSENLYSWTIPPNSNSATQTSSLSGSFKDFCYGSGGLTFINGSNALSQSNQFKHQYTKTIEELRCSGSLFCTIDSEKTLSCRNSTLQFSEVFSRSGYISAYTNGVLICGLTPMGSVDCWDSANFQQKVGISGGVIKLGETKTPCFMKKDGTLTCANNQQPGCFGQSLCAQSGNSYTFAQNAIEYIESVVVSATDLCFLSQNSMTCSGGISSPASVVTLTNTQNYTQGLIQKPCGLGYYYGSLYQASSICSGPCDGGTWGTGEGSCVGVCPTGSYCSPGSITPKICPAGTYNGQTSRASLSECLSCPLGYYCLAGAISGTTNKCQAGYYGNIPGQNSSSCNGPCQSGYRCMSGSTSDTQFTCGSLSVYCPPGSPNPTPATPGYYTIGGSTTDTATGQTLCTPGHYCQEGRQIECNVGFYSNQTGLSSCYPCEAGSVAGQTGLTGCSKCDPGSATGTTPPFLYCQVCQPGFYQDKAGQATCQGCSLGNYQSMSGQTTCNKCPGMTVSSVPNSVACGACTGFIDSTHSTCYSNSLCLPGYGPVNGTVDECHICPINTYSLANNTMCTTCPQGTYTLKTGSTACLECDQFASCGNGEITIQSGYWPIVDLESGSIKTYQCTSFEHCNEQTWKAGSKPQVCPDDRSQDADNVLCSRCAPGFIDWNQKCIPCTQPNGGRVFFWLFVGWIMTQVLYFTSQKTGTVTSHVTYTVQAVLVYVTFVSPLSNQNFLLQFLNAQVESATGGWCVIPMSSAEYYLYSLIQPLLLLAILFLNGLVHKYLMKYCLDSSCWSKLPARVEEFDAVKYGRAFCTLSLLVYVSWAQTCFRYLYCIDIGPYTVVRSTPALSCNSDEYKSLRGLIVTVLLIVVVMPLVLLYLFRYSRFSTGIFDLSGKLGQILDVWSSVYNESNKHWIVAQWLKRGFLVAVSMITLPMVRFLIFFLFHWMFKTMNNKFKPYKHSTDKHWDNHVLTYLCLLAVFCMVGYNPNKGHIDEGYYTTILVTVFIVAGYQVFIIIGRQCGYFLPKQERGLEKHVLPATSATEMIGVQVRGTSEPFEVRIDPNLGKDSKDPAKPLTPQTPEKPNFDGQRKDGLTNTPPSTNTTAPSSVDSITKSDEELLDAKKN